MDSEAHVRLGQIGVGLDDAPGHEFGRPRTPWMPDYGSYWDVINTPDLHDRGARMTAPTAAATCYLGADGWWHGRVTVGVEGNGEPDRRHVMGKTETDVLCKVRRLERGRDSGKIRIAGRPETVAQWLEHWLKKVAARTVRPKTRNGSETPNLRPRTQYDRVARRNIHGFGSRSTALVAVVNHADTVGG